MSALANHGIRLRDERPGEHRCPCPECAKIKHRPCDDALAVKLEPDGGATWWCFRCGWKGGLPPAGGRAPPPGGEGRDPPRKQTAPPGARRRHRNLNAWSPASPAPDGGCG